MRSRHEAANPRARDDLRFASFADRAEQPRRNHESHAVAWILEFEIERWAIDDSTSRKPSMRTPLGRTADVNDSF
jgi:hypothetical protein